MEHISLAGLPATDARRQVSGQKVRLWFKTDTAGTQETSDDVWGAYEWDSRPSDKILYFYGNQGTGANPPNNTSGASEIVSRRIEFFDPTVSATQVLVTVAIRSEQGRAPMPASVTFDLSPRSMRGQ
jgi:hypothetical protein